MTKIYIFFYKNQINNQIDIILNTTNNNLNSQNIVDLLYTQVITSITNAKNKTLEYQKSMQSFQVPTNPNKKKWFTWELKQIKTRMCAIRQLQKRSTDHLLESELRNLKTEFRRIQRQNI